MILARMELHQSIPIIEGFFSLTYVRNTGAAFGILAGRFDELRVPLLLSVAMLALAVVPGSCAPCRPSAGA